MAYELIKVSELPELTTPSDPNVLPIQDGDYLKRISFENLKDAAVGDMEGSLAAAYDSTATYAVGDYCIYEGQLYRCTTAITTAEAWTAGHWTAAVLTDDIASDLSTEASTRSTNDNALAADIAEALGDLAAVYSTSATYAVGDYCIYQGQLYRCTTAITTAEAWTSGHWAAVALGNDTRDLRSALTSETEAREAADEALEESVTEILTDYAQKDGTYEDLTSGNAEVLLSDVYTENSEPYLFRKTGGSDNVGDRKYLDKIVGGSLVWNQYIDKDSYAASETVNGITFTNNADGSVTANGTATDTVAHGLGTVPKSILVVGHVYYVGANFSVSGSAETYEFQITRVLTSNAFHAYTDTMFKLTSTPASSASMANYVVRSGTTVTNLKLIPQLIDLTAEFGTTIADYVYSLETATAGSGVAWLRQYIDIDSYHPYSEPTLKHVEGLVSHDTTGLNQWNEDWEVGTYGNNAGILAYGGPSYTTMIRSKTPIRVLPNTTYAFFCNDPNYNAGFYVWESEGVGEPVTGMNNTSSSRFMTYTTTAKATHLVFATRTGYGDVYKHDVSVHIRGNGAKDEVYEPYQKHSYPLDSSVVLRGYPMLVDGRLNYDGDEYLPSGVINRNYGIRAYQSGDESLANAITDGTNTVYKLTTPTTETAEPFRQLQICDTYGTEEFVTTSEIPVGTETRYPEDLKSKIEGLPWDLSMIAPIEDGTTASQAYTAGQYFLHNNVFCKALTSIASGATFTLNTNYSETTVAAELYTALH